MTPAEAAATALGVPVEGMHNDGWDYNPTDHAIVVPYDGDPGISQEVAVFQIHDVTQE